MDDVARGGAAGAETSEIGAVAAPGRERRMTASRKRGGHSLGAGFDQLFHQLGDGPIIRDLHPVLLGKGTEPVWSLSKICRPQDALPKRRQAVAIALEFPTTEPQPETIRAKGSSANIAGLAGAVDPGLSLTGDCKRSLSLGQRSRDAPFIAIVSTNSARSR